MFSNKNNTAARSQQEIQDRITLIEQHKVAVIKGGRLPPDNVLTTEKNNDVTVRLSQMAQNNIPAAIQALKTVDLAALNLLQQVEQQVAQLNAVMHSTLSAGNKIFFTGCGSAGRAGVLVDRIIRDSFPDSNYKEQIIPVLAGGDASIVRAAEGFEDNKAFGIKQLLVSGYDKNDLVLCLTASGSADYIHAQLEYVAEHGNRKPYFIYCNTHEEVATTFAHKPIFNHPTMQAKIEFLSIDVGNMGLGGSTRMQAATAQVLILAVPLLDAVRSLEQHLPYENSWSHFLTVIHQQLNHVDLDELSHLIKLEAAIYSRGHYIYRFAPAYLGLNALVNDAECAPTYNTNYPENDLDKNTQIQASLSRILIDNALNAEDAWLKILARPLRPLNWQGVPHTAEQRILAYDLSSDIIKKREVYIGSTKHHSSSIYLKNGLFSFLVNDVAFRCRFDENLKLPVHLHALADQIMVKLILNTYSTLVFGRMGFYFSNVMACVRPSNIKLISRSVRLSYELAMQLACTEYAVVPALMQQFEHNANDRALFIGYTTKIIYAQMLLLGFGESIVLSTLHQLMTDFLTPLSYQYLVHIAIASEKLRIPLRMNVWADCDGSMDDLMALMILLTDPNVNVIGITIPGGTGEVRGLAGAENISRLCQLVGQSNIPIGYTDVTSFSALGTAFPDWLRDKVDSIFSDTALQDYRHASQFKDAVSLMKDVLDAYPDHSVVIQATGPMTNIALFTQKYPEYTRKFLQMIVMGGAIDVPGNIKGLIQNSPNEFAEWNIFADPVAAQLAFSAGIPTLLVALDATNQIPMTKMFYHAFAEAEHPALKFIHKIQTDLINIIGEAAFYSEFYLWDPLTALLLTMQELISKIKTLYIQIDLSRNPITMGRTKRCLVEDDAPCHVSMVTELHDPETILEKLVELYESRFKASVAHVRSSGYFAATQNDDDNTQLLGINLSPRTS